MKKKTHIGLLIIMIFFFLGAGVSEGGSWKEDFERLCSLMEEASGLPVEKLTELIEESDQLLKTIEVIDDPQKKIYLFRLKKCKNFFVYSLELKEVEKTKESASQKME